jgi:hypothetical protein
MARVRISFSVLLVLAFVAASLATTTTTATASSSPESRTPVMQRERLTAQQLAAYFKANRPATLPYRATVPIEELTAYYIQEGRAEGVAGDIAFAQAIHETAWFNYPSHGQVKPSDNNFGGMGACDGGTCTVARFATARQGVRAQIHHLRAYADPTVTVDRLASPLVQPLNGPSRFDLVQPKGRAPLWENFGPDPVNPGVNWATDPAYAQRVLDHFVRITRWVDANGGKVGAFSDVRSGNAHFSGIQTVYNRGITEGCTTYAFCPTSLTTRGQMATFIVRAFDIPLSSNDRFTDVSGTHRRAINALADRGIVRGCTETEFCPQEPVTRAQTATLLQRTLKLPRVNAPFSDVSGTHAGAIGAIAKAGIAEGYGMPPADILRAVTINPARVLGVADRVGSLEPGKDADVILLDGPPLSMKTWVERVWVNGELVHQRVAGESVSG